MRQDSSTPIVFSRFDSGQWKAINAEIVTEKTVNLHVNGEPWFSFLCTPTDLSEMAAGFLYNEGFIESSEEINFIEVCDSMDNIDVWLNHSLEKPGNWKRTSGCTGGFTQAAIEHAELKHEINGFRLSPEDIGELTGMLLDRQELYRVTGGVHTSILCQRKEIVFVSEDIGRHNTLDKISGKCLLNNVSCPEGVLLTTGRISSEMLQKAARIKVTFVMSRTSPSSLSIELAQSMGLTLIGYGRRNSFNVYSFPERVS
jgi:FdhD protein